MKRLATNKNAAAVRIFKKICIYFNTTKKQRLMINKKVNLKNFEFFYIIIQTILKRLATNKIAAAVRIFKTICIYFNTTKNKDR